MKETRSACRQSAWQITQKASTQTYLTLRYLADKELKDLAFEAYAYFRWVDDVLDASNSTTSENVAFVQRQVNLLEACYAGLSPVPEAPEEEMLIDLVKSDPQRGNGLNAYLVNMMEVMIFDTCRRGKEISQAQLDEYTLKLAISVTEALHYFIGHNQPAGLHPQRYLAVSAAHITHMLRDHVEDCQTGYFNLPSETLQMLGLQPGEVDLKTTRDWVCKRVRLAREYFEIGRRLLAGDPCLRRRLAGLAYLARFEWVLRRIERDHFCLRADYSQRKGLSAALWMTAHTLSAMFHTVNLSKKISHHNHSLPMGNP